MEEKKGAFRFTYFTNKYQDTFDFFADQLEFNCIFSWDRDENDKGALFNAGAGIIEFLQLPNDERLFNDGLDHRPPVGSFMCIQVWDVEKLFGQYKAKGIPFKQEVTNQPWGHKSFSITDPNGVVLMFFEEMH